MESLTVLHILVFFLLCNIISLLLLFFKKNGNLLSVFFNTCSTFIFLFLLNIVEVTSLGEAFGLNASKIQLINFVGAFILIAIVINGRDAKTAIFKGIMFNYMFLLSIFLIGAKDALTSFICLFAIMYTIYYLFLLIGKNFCSRQSFFKISFALLIQLLAVGFFYLSTGSLKFFNVVIISESLFLVFLYLQLIIGCLILGVFPFDIWIGDIIKQFKNGELVASLMVCRLILPYVIFSSIQDFLPLVNSNLSKIFYESIFYTSLISCIFGGLLSLSKDCIINAVANLSQFFAGVFLFTFVISGPESFQSNQMFYLLFNTIAIAGLVLTFKKNISRQLSGSVQVEYIARFFPIFIIIILMLSLIGMPPLAGLSANISVFSELINSKFALESFILLGSSIVFVGHVGHLVIIFSRRSFDLAIKKTVSLDYNSKFFDKIVQLFFALVVIIGGIVPSLFFK